jgi:hypothetical protein
MGKKDSTYQFTFEPVGQRDVKGAFDGGTLTSDSGGILLRSVEKICHIIKQFSQCFTDYRDPEKIEHTTEELVGQRVYGLALGYEDLNDHDELRRDPLLATLVEKEDPSGQNRNREQDKGKALAGKSTLNRLELTPPDANEKSRYKKIVLNPEKVDAFFVAIFLQAYPKPPKRIVLDVDATDDPLHGNQEGRFFNGYYKEYCYMPLYIFCGDFLLCARLRQSNIDASKGCVEEVARIVKQIRTTWPEVEIVVRGDAGFCREKLMAWCEANEVHYILGLPQNPRLRRRIKRTMKKARREYVRTRKAARRFTDFWYKTRDTWSRKRRVIAKAEYLAKGENPRFVVTSYTAKEYGNQTLYETEYCARGEMENRIKEQQLFLFADRTSTHEMRSNQIRLWFSSVAYMLIEAFRRLGLQGTEMEQAQCNTIRLKLFKLGARIRVTARRVLISFASSYPYQDLFQFVYTNLQKIPLRC